MIETDERTDNFLAHFGVKGMRWGHRKARDDDGGNQPKKLTRKEVRAEKREFYQKRAENTLKIAAEKGDDVLVKTRDPLTGYTTVSTGKEFADYMAKGGYMDVKVTDVYATLDKKQGGFVLNPSERYVRSDKKK